MGLEPTVFFQGGGRGRADSSLAWSIFLSNTGKTSCELILRSKNLIATDQHDDTDSGWPPVDFSTAKRCEML